MRLRFHLEAEDGVHRRRAARYWNDRGRGLELLFDRCAGAAEPGFVQHVGLRQHDQVGSADLVGKQLVDRAFMIEFLVGGALRLERVEVMRHPAIGQRRAIDKRDNPVEHHLRFDVGPVEGLDKRLRQGESGCFDNDVVGLRFLRQKLLDARQEIIGHGAADTAIRELYNIFGAAAVSAAFLQHVAIHADIAEFIDDQRQAFAVGLHDDVADERCLAGAEKAGDDGGRDAHWSHLRPPSAGGKRKRRMFRSSGVPSGPGRAGSVKCRDTCRRQRNQGSLHGIPRPLQFGFEGRSPGSRSWPGTLPGSALPVGS